MWVSKSIFDWFGVTRDTVDQLRAELVGVRAERDQLRIQAAVNQTHFDWLRSKVNQLEMERAGLIEKAYNIKLPAVPELFRTPARPIDPSDLAVGFDDIGDDVARVLGLPIHGPNNQ